MKSKLSFLFSIILCLSLLLCLTGCGETKNENVEESAATESTEDIDVGVVGGWTIPEEKANVTLDEGAKDAFDKACGDYELVAFLGSQVVAGQNFGYLCKSQSGSLCKVTVYYDLDKKATITDTKEVVLSDYTTEKDVSFNAEDLAGGWTVNTTPATLSEDVQTVFDKALEGFAGVSYKPLALLGTQVVAGTNYAILCTASTVTAEPSSALAVLVIYADLQGNAEITSIAGFDVP